MTAAAAGNVWVAYPLDPAPGQRWVPVLVLEDGEVLVDSVAILDFVDEMVGPERALLPPSRALRRRALQVMALATGCSDKAAGIVYERTQRAPEKVDESCKGSAQDAACRATIRFVPHSVSTSNVLEPGKTITIFNTKKAELSF